VWRDLRLVIFDCDGVLVDSEPISNRVLAEMLSREGLPTTLAQSRREYQGMLLADIRTRAESKLGRALPEDWIARYEAERDTAFNRELKPVTGALEAVAQVTAAGIQTCIASQGKLTKIGLSLGLTGLDRFFPASARFSSYSVARGKPAPDVFLHAAASMGADPRACVVVEDTPSGVTAAVSAGMCALGFAADSDEQALRDAGAARILRSLHELTGVIGIERHVHR
jgi:beta-phosphoglucomutase-like phosphatase (HAD superfamily)